MNRTKRPLVGLTMGDAAGIGPEVIARAWLLPRLHDLARPLVIGDPAVLERALALVGSHTHTRVQIVAKPEEADPSPRVVPCLAVAANVGDLSLVAPGIVDARAGR